MRSLAKILTPSLPATVSSRDKIQMKQDTDKHDQLTALALHVYISAAFEIKLFLQILR